MSKALLSSSAAGLWLAFTVVCPAQMSTFPSPPPLPPPSSSRQSDNSGNGNAVPAAPANPAPLSPSEQLAPPPAQDTTPMSRTPVAATLSSMGALDDKTTLGVGDRISFRVIEDRDDAVPRQVTDTGEVDFPYVGRIKVQGLTCHQVAVKLKQLLEIDYYKHATVIVGLDVIASNGGQMIAQDTAWVIGQVRQVGPQVLSKVQPMTVSQIILRAGGFGDFADQRKVRIIHRSAPKAGAPAGPPVDLNNSQEGQLVDVKAVYAGQSGIDPVIQPNDYIIVPKRLVNF